MVELGSPDRPSRPRTLVGSIRFRITAVATLAVIAVLVVTAVLIVSAQRRILTDNLDDTLRQRADDLAAIAASGQLPPALSFSGDDDTVAQVVTAEGQVLAASANVEGEPALATAPANGRGEVLRTLDLTADDDPFRVLSRRIEGEDGTLVLHVAGTLDSVTDSSDVLASSLTLAIPAVAALLAVLVWWLVGRTLRPVEAIRREVATISGTALDRRVPEPPGDDEIGRLARTMNAMLDRVDHAAQRQRRFVADASHELRSPLTRIRSELEVDLAHRESADLTATHHSVLDETVTLQRLVDDLLLLARTDTAAPPPRRDPVDLDDLVLEETRRLRADGALEIDSTAVSAAQVRGDRDQLARALRNLVENASRHAATRMQLTLAEVDGEAVLTVADDGPGIPVTEHERVFERFTRVDDARSANDGGTGLGLAIVHDIVVRHGGSVVIDPDHSPGTRMVLRLPVGTRDQGT